ncbi:hypothetical protein CS0771_42690 [Catellatospora sp. IY07-71]|nr:hypothetical protein CS0771_42690 [Catellatospora sp. IY07-71]
MALSVVGALGALTGLFALVISGGMSHWLVFGAVLVASGMLLLWTGLRGPLPGPLAWAAIVVLTVAGMALSLLVVREQVCCMFVYHHDLGYPWSWLLGYGEAETMTAVEELRARAGDLPRHVHRGRFLAGTAFWAGAALLLVLPVTLLWRRAER